jgi:hypothetical protein
MDSFGTAGEKGIGIAGALQMSAPNAARRIGAAHERL